MTGSVLRPGVSRIFEVSMDERRGGCAGNIAYSLALLGEKPVIISAAGRDFGPYAAELQAKGLPLDGIRRVEDIFTALCYITTDLNSNQITGFYPGAMANTFLHFFPFARFKKHRTYMAHE